MMEVNISFMRTSGHSALPLFIVNIAGYDEVALTGWDDVTHYVLATLGEIEESTKTQVIYEKVS